MLYILRLNRTDAVPINQHNRSPREHLTITMKVWYSSTKMLKAIHQLGNTVYERTVLAVLFSRYAAMGFHVIRKPGVTIALSYRDVEFIGCMKRTNYYKALRNLSDRNIILIQSTKGRSGKQNISIILPITVAATKARRFNTQDIVNDLGFPNLTTDSISTEPATSM